MRTDAFARARFITADSEAKAELSEYSSTFAHLLIFIVPYRSVYFK